MPSQKRLNELFVYRDGHLYRKIDRPPYKAGQRVYSRKGNGYLRVGVDSKNCLAHRVIWIMHHGPIPEAMEIDHIDHDASNNRIENLRIVSSQENKTNASIQRNNTSGHVGVDFEKRKSRWRARINYLGKEYTLGYYATVQEAARARKTAELRLGFHPNHGIESKRRA